MQMNFFDNLINHAEMRESLKQDQLLSARCILAADKSNSKKSKEFLFSVGNYGFLVGQLTEKQRLAARATIRGVAMAG